MLNLTCFGGNREAKWTGYFDKHKDVLEEFRNFWPNPNEIETYHVVSEMEKFYKWLSEKYNTHADRNYIVWHRSTLSPVRNKIAEFLCKDLKMNYGISEEIENSNGIGDIPTKKIYL